VYSPLELLLFIAGCCTIADSFVPQLINVPKATVTHVVRSVLSMSFVIGAATVVYNLKSRFFKEQAWQCEMQGDVTSQRRWEAYDKLGPFATYGVTVVLSIQVGGRGGKGGRGQERVTLEPVHVRVVPRGLFSTTAAPGTCVHTL
jgi:MscS family membrane protein